MSVLSQHIEALIFCAFEPVSLDDILKCLKEVHNANVDKKEVEDEIEKLKARYTNGDYTFSIQHFAGGYQFLTKPSYQHTVSTLLKQNSKKRLSTSALETLAIIAYKQPVTKTEIEQIRGVNCDYAVQKLLERELLEIKGKSDAIGRPLLYGTSTKFMEYFGINDLSELPQLKDIKLEENEIGDADALDNHTDTSVQQEESTDNGTE